MRWIVASLVIINVGLFAYFQLFSKDSDSIAVAKSNSSNLTSGLPKVLLLEEQSSAPQSVTIAARSEIKPPIEEAPAPLSTVTETATVQALPPTRSAPAINGQPLCSLVGPFDRLLSAEYFVENVTAQSVSAEIKNIVVSEKTGYWLHLRPEPSRKEALRRLSELQKRGIDSYVIPSGNLANGISLGMFSRQDRAEAMLAQIKEQGYQPLIATVPQEKKEIWVFFPQGEAGKLSDQRWSELLSSSQYLQKRQNLCSDIASS